MAQTLFVTPRYITAKEIKNVRKKLGLTQKDFAMLLNCFKSTVERWETSNQPVEGPISLLMELLGRQPELAEDFKVPERTYPLRLWYMHNQTVCTLMNVDDGKQQVRIKNYTDHIMFRAFGREEHPDYTMYMEFLSPDVFREVEIR